MASIFLAGIGSAIGGSLGSGAALAASAGKFAGSMLGSVVDQTLFKSDSTHNTEDRRLDEIKIQKCGYGQIISTVYGNAKISGNIIWADKIKEHKSQSITSHSTKWSENTHTHTSYHYTISFAVAICKGPITAVEHIWADDTAIHKNDASIRIYCGTEDQMPDPLIENIEAVGQSSAYRGLAYIVFENFNITLFNNRIPNFTFEVRNTINTQSSIRNTINAVNIIPGGGEFVYDTKIQFKSQGEYKRGADNQLEFIAKSFKEKINCHNSANKANCLVSLDQLQKTLPNVQWAAPVVTWFMDFPNFQTFQNGNKCRIAPGVETQDIHHSTSEVWSVGGYNRNTACNIKEKNNRPIYGGTVNDTAILRYLDELRSRGYKIMFYPMLFVNLHEKPWRGRYNCETNNVHDFFNDTEGYNAFILHYANLVKGKVDAFIIGSEMVGLTKAYKELEDGSRTFPAIQELIKLSIAVRKILGPEVLISYAADWSEYHHSLDGWYHMDELWSSPNIDFVGIDAYFPLTSYKKTTYNLNDVIKGWSSGEDYDYYYSYDKQGNAHKIPLEPQYANKNIKWWWENKHIQPNGQETTWRPKSKKIWFTEYGFPSIDLATNQPNCFYEKDGSESSFPQNSNGAIDIFAQRLGIEATEIFWHNSDIVENKFLWTWDARPYPIWPENSEFWNDSSSWHRGHWIQGKIDNVTLPILLAELAEKAGLQRDEIEVHQISDIVDGFVIQEHTTIRSIIEDLQKIYFFDVVENNNKVQFIARTNKELYSIQQDDIIVLDAKNHPNLLSSNGQHSEYLNIQKIQEFDLPNKIDLHFISRSNSFEIHNQHYQREQTKSKLAISYSLPIVLDNERADKIVEAALYNMWSERYHYNFMLPISYAYLKPSDVVEFVTRSKKHTVRITNIELSKNYKLKINGVSEDLTIYSSSKYDIEEDNNVNRSNYTQSSSDSQIEILDIPITHNEEIFSKLNHPSSTNPQNSRLLIAACGTEKEWYGCQISYQIYQENEQKAIEDRIVALNNSCRATIGRSLTPLSAPKNPYIIDTHNKIEINLMHGELTSVEESEMLNGANLMMIGNEILQFQKAQLIDHKKYLLSNFLRGLYGTNQNAVMSHDINTRVILLDHNIHSLHIPYSISNASLNLKIQNLTKSSQVQKPLEIPEADGKHSIQLHSYHPLPVTHLRCQNNPNGSKVVYWNGQKQLQNHNQFIQEKQHFLIKVYNGKKKLINSATIEEGPNCQFQYKIQPAMLIQEARSVSVSSHIENIKTESIETFLDLI